MIGVKIVNRQIILANEIKHYFKIFKYIKKAERETSEIKLKNYEEI
jgi:hypothetical protein